MKKIISLLMVVVILMVTFQIDTHASSIINDHQVEDTNEAMSQFGIREKGTMNYTSYSDAGILGAGALSSAGLYPFIIANLPTILVGGAVIGVGIGAYFLFNHLVQNLETAVPVYTGSIARHLESDAVVEITKKRTYTDLYYSPVNDRAMIVYNIDEHIYGDVSSPMGIPYLRTHYGVDLYGFKLIVLVELNHNKEGSETKFYHAEIRRGVHASRQIEFMRYKNQMTVQLYRNPSVDNKYLDTDGYTGPMASPYQMQK